MALNWVREPGPEQEYASPVNKHDIGYKYLLSSKRIFIQLLRSFVHQGWVRDMDENNIMRLDKSFILQDFQGKEADLVYRLSLNGKDVIFYLLLELQAKVDYAMPYRLLMYMVEIWRSLYRDETAQRTSSVKYRLPVIVPCVLYNGKGKWTACRRFGDYQEGFAAFKDYALDFRYILIDINRYSEVELLQLANVIGSVFLMEKCCTEDLLICLEEVAGILQHQDDDCVQTFLTWLQRILVRELPKEKIQAIQTIIQGEREVSAVSSNIAKAFIREFEARQKKGMELGLEQGREQGREQGAALSRRKIAKNLLVTGLDPELVAKSTEISLAEVLAIKDEQESI